MNNFFKFIILLCIGISTILFCVNSNSTSYYSINCSTETTVRDITITDQDDAGSGGDAGNTFSNATDITFGTFICNLPEGDDDDFYKFYLSLSYQLSISIAGKHQQI